MVTLEESGMVFGKYQEKDFFQIERSQLYQKSLMPAKVKTTEFLLFREGKKGKAGVLLFVEAKTNPQMSKEKFEKYVDDIALKFTHTLSVYFSMQIGRLSNEELPEMLKKLDKTSVNPQLLLVVKNCTKDEADILKEKLRSCLRPALKIWNIDREILVFNEQMAADHSLVIRSDSTT